MVAPIMIVCKVTMVAIFGPGAPDSLTSWTAFVVLGGILAAIAHEITLWWGRMHTSWRARRWRCAARNRAADRQLGA